MGAELETNSKIGPFRILEPLGSGGANDVFLAEDEAGTRVVLKILAAPERNQGLFDPRIADEASTYAALKHPNIIKVLDLFSTEGRFVIALEWVDGASLSVVRAALKRQGSTLGDFAILYVCAAVFSALAAAHGALDAAGQPAPVVHRNVNPSNVHLLWDGSVKLGNFNVANVVTVLRDSSPGLTWGSYGYFAPEQVKQQPVGPAADVYAASLVLWELLAGRKAIDRGSMTDAEVLTAMASPKIPLLETVRTDLDRRLLDALRLGLEVDPARRTLTAAQMRDLLTGLVNLDAERARLGATLEGVRPLAARARLPSKPGITGKVAPPRPTAQSIPPPHPAPAAAAEAEPDPFSGPVISLPTPPPPAPPPPPPRAPKASLKATLALGVEAHAPAVPARPIVTPAPAPVVAAPPPTPAFVATPAPAPEVPLAPEAPPAPPRLATPEPHAPPYGGDAVALEPAAPGRRRSWVPVALSGSGIALATFVVVVLMRSDGPAPMPVVAVAPAIVPLASASQTEPLAPVASSAPPVPAPSVPPPPASPAPSAATAASVDVPAPPPTPSATPEIAAIPVDQGELRFPPFAAGHRIFVDGHVVGDGALPALVRCGLREVRIGSAGTPQHVNVPCGGSTAVGSR